MPEFSGYRELGFYQKQTFCDHLARVWGFASGAVYLYRLI
jgi:hypothetical protein